MREFNKINGNFWQSDSLLKLESDDAKFLLFYMMTCPHLNSAGCFPLPDGYACCDLLWEVDRYETARKELIEKEVIAFDEENHVVLILCWFEHNPPMNSSHLKGTCSQLKRVPSERLVDACKDELYQFTFVVNKETTRKSS